jgi:hypothetical protein
MPKIVDRLSRYRLLEKNYTQLNRCLLPLYLRTEKDPASETSCSSIPKNTARWKKSKNPIILCAIYSRQKPVKSTCSAGLVVENLAPNCKNLPAKERGFETTRRKR